MLLKSYELTSPALDWAVGIAANVDGLLFKNKVLYEGNGRKSYYPSDDWYLVGPLLDELKMSVMHVEDDDPLPIEDGPWTAAVPGADWGYTGPTALIAICRCYVQHKLGDDVEIPDELFKG